MTSIEDFSKIVGEAEVEEIKSLAERVKGTTVTHVNSTSYGGGVAEILKSLIPIANTLGLKARWHVIKGSEDFFDVTKKFHHALQGMPLRLEPSMRRIYIDHNKKNAENFNLRSDLIFIHDPQPAAMINFCKDVSPRWIWRCHIDMTNANRSFWNFLKPFVEKYDAIVFSLEKYVRDDIRHKRIYFIPPSINPLSEKNRELSSGELMKVLEKFGIDPDRPIVIQVARFDPWKDPIGAIQVYRMVKKKIPSIQLVLAGSLALDDPEGEYWLKKTIKYAKGDRDVHILSNLDGVGELEINAFQRASTVALQLSIREGFALSVTEALWKGVPVIGRRTGGIPLQVIDDFTGFLVETYNEAAKKLIHLLKNPSIVRYFGENGREHVRRNFLITRHLKQYIKLQIEIA